MVDTNPPMYGMNPRKKARTAIGKASGRPRTSMMIAQAAFAANGCAACHTFAPASSTGTIGPDLDKLKAYAAAANMPLDNFIHESIVNPDAYIEKGYAKGVMPTTFNSLPKGTLDALVAFLAAGAK